MSRGGTVKRGIFLARAAPSQVTNSMQYTSCAIVSRGKASSIDRVHPLQAQECVLVELAKVLCFNKPSTRRAPHGAEFTLVNKVQSKIFYITKCKFWCTRDSSRFCTARHGTRCRHVPAPCSAPTKTNSQHLNLASLLNFMFQLLFPSHKCHNVP
jgi:hypothetical protein